MTTASPCGKRMYLSAHAAKGAHRKASCRLQPYYCSRCRGWHVTASEKRHSGHVRRHG